MLQKINELIQVIGGWDVASGTIAIIVEFALRMIKSSKPLSLLYVVVDSLSAVAKLLDKAAQFLDKILPQRLK